jgi:hypothetical protein
MPARLAVRHGIIIVLSIAVCGLLAFARGQDTNFDQLNYHYYSAYAYETHRLEHDVAPAQVMHSYFSPIVYLPFYHLVRTLPPRAVGFALGALQGLNVWLVIVIAGILARALPVSARIPSIVAATVISLAGPMVISQLGTSFADILVSIPTLGGLALLLEAGPRTDGRVRGAFARVAVGAALLGAATSLKLTAAPFALAYAVASAVGWQSWRHRVAALVAAGIGGAVGFTLIGGWWYAEMWRMFGNPVFPYFNNLFRSPDFPSATALFDSRYIPHGPLEALAYPFRWLFTQHSTTEIDFRDIRFAVLLILAALAVVQLARRHAPTTGAALGAAARSRLIVFLSAAFVMWMYEWSIQRYLLSLELLTGPAVLALLIWSGLFERRPRGLAATAAAIAVLSVATVRPPDWGHLGWRSEWYSFDPPPVGTARPVYFMASEPMSFIIPSLPAGAVAISAVVWEPLPDWGDTVFRHRIESVLSDPTYGPIWAVASPGLTDGVVKLLARYGLRQDGACITEPRGRPFPLTWCKLTRIAAPAS